MTDPSQYFKGRTVQEQMNEVIGYVDVRSAEVATDAIAADVAQVHSDAADAHADALAAAASAAAAAGTLANAVKKTGEASQSIAGDIIISGALSAGSLGVGGHATLTDVTVSGIASVPTPTGNNYATNKKYVDDADALKADKTYVDAQDALKINIADINSYAVGLTGSQGPIAGIKSFEYTINNNFVLKDTPSPGAGTWRRLFTCSASSSGSNRCVSIVLVGTRSPVMDIVTVNYGGLTGTGSSAIMLGAFNVRVCRNNDGNIEIWTNSSVYGYCIIDAIRTSGKFTNCHADLSAADTTEPVVGGDFSAVATPTQVIS